MDMVILATALAIPALYGFALLFSLIFGKKPTSDD